MFSLNPTATPLTIYVATGWKVSIRILPLSFIWSNRSPSTIRDCLCDSSSRSIPPKCRLTAPNTSEPWVFLNEQTLVSPRPSLQFEGDFSAPASTSRRGFGGGRATAPAENKAARFSARPVQPPFFTDARATRQEALEKKFHPKGGPGRPRGKKTPPPPPVGGAASRLLLLPRAHGRHEDDMLDARLHGRVDGSDVLRSALSGFRIGGRDD